MQACAGGGGEEEGAVRRMGFAACTFAAGFELIEAQSRAWARGIEW